MKVVEGDFTQQKTEELPLKELMEMVLEEGELGGLTDYTFVLLVDTDERLTFGTNSVDKPELLYMMETIKQRIMTGDME